MDASALAKHIRTRAIETLNANLPCDKRESTHSEEDIQEQGRWLIALWHAQSTRDFNEREMAELFLDGIEPVLSIEEECKDLTDADFPDSAQDLADFVNSL